MLYAIRALAVFMFGASVYTAYLVFYFYKTGALFKLVANGAFGIATLVAWAIVIVFGVPAAVLLWRRKELGRILTMLLASQAALYNLVGCVVWAGPNGVSLVSILSGVFNLLMLQFLLWPGVRKSFR